MKNLKSFVVLSSLVAIVAMGCSKGTTGPAGPAGPKGPAGPDSVVHSAWTALAMTFNTTDSLYEQTITAPAITQRILDSGVIVTYLSIVDNNNVTNVVNASVYFINEIFTPGSIALGSRVDYTGFNYRYVIIPGTIVAGHMVSGPAKGYTQNQLETMGYDAVQKLLGTSSSSSNN